MKFIILLSVIAMAAAAPTDIKKEEIIPIRQSSHEMRPDGSYKYSFETADGIIREETGSIVNPGKEDSYVVTSGLYKFLNPDGETVEVHYTADTKGFIPRGTNIL